MNRIIMVLTGLLIFPASVPAGQITVEQFIDKLKSRPRLPQKYIIKSEQLTQGTNTKLGGYSTESRDIIEYRIDGEKRDLIKKKIFIKDPPFMTRIIDGKPFIQMSRTTWAKGKYMEYSEGPNFKTLLISYSRPKMKRHFERTEPGRFLRGNFSGDLPALEKILAEATDVSIRSQMEDVGGFMCYVLNAVTPHGKYNIWLDPEHGYNISKAEVHKRIGDICIGKPLGTQKTFTPPGYKGPKLSPANEVSYLYDNFKFEKIQGNWFAVEGSSLWTMKYADGSMSTLKISYKQTSIELNPDFEAIDAFVQEISEDTKVSVDGSGFRYKWIDGRPVPNTGR